MYGSSDPRAAGAAVEWRELVVLGRTGEPPGRATLRRDVTRARYPAPRQLTDLTGPGGPAHPRGGGCWPARSICDPELAARTVVASPVAAAQRVDGHTLLVTVLGDDADGATRQLGAVRRARGLTAGPAAAGARA